MRQQVKLGTIIQQIRGVSYKPTDVRNADDPDAVALLRANNIQDDGLNFDDLVFVDKKKVSPEQMIRKGDIVICASSGSKNLVGKAAVANCDIPYTFGAFCKVVRITSMDAAFVGQYFRSPRYRSEISAASAGANINNIRNEHIDEMYIPVYTEAKQREIAHQLLHIDKLIRDRHEQLALIDQLVKSRFIEMFEGKGYPKLKWNEVFHTATGKLDSNAMVEDGQYPFFTCAKEVYRIDKYAFDQEALLLAGNNAAGKYDVKYYKGKFNAYQRTYVLGLKHDWSYQLFRYQLEDKLDYLQQQSLGGLTKYLTIKILGELDFIVPPMDKQNEFTTFVEQIDKSKLAVQKSIDKLETLKKSLMQQYFG